MAPGLDSPKPAKIAPKESIETRAQPQPPVRLGTADPPGPRPDPVNANAKRPNDSNAPQPVDHRMAKEEEAGKFIENYIKHYTLMDIHGFLAFFSSRVIQNQTDDLNEIRSIYTHYFNESQKPGLPVEGSEDRDLFEPYPCQGLL